MVSIIAQRPLNLIKNLILILCLGLSSCFAAKQKAPELTSILVTPQGVELTTRLALTLEQQGQGLSGVQPEDFTDTEAMLFVYDSEGVREFWMPDTYFNLDIFFLDENLRVIDVERNVPAHPGMVEPPPIARTRSIRSWHVLELKASSPHARSLRIGDQLKWKGDVSLTEIKSNIRQRQ
jgi:uncharacterized protein